MKELTTYNRVAGYLNKIFDLLNEGTIEGTYTLPAFGFKVLTNKK